MLLPNTFLIGTQKSGSTSLYDWISQHPDVCGDLGLKDLSFLVKDELYEKGLSYLSDMFLDIFDNQKIIFHSSVQYVYYKKGVERLKHHFPDGKFILILRNPLDRLISAFSSCIKLELENEADIMTAAIYRRNERSQSLDYDIRSQLTYIDHSLYARQIEVFLTLFKRNQLFVCFYEDMKKDPRKLVHDIYSFLDIDTSFVPDFGVMNKTGVGLKNIYLHRMLFRRLSLQSKIRRYFVDQIIDRFLPLNKRNQLKWRIKKWNTIQSSSSGVKINISYKEKEELLKYFIGDIEALERILNINLDHWKQIN